MYKLCFSTLGCHDKTFDEILELANKYAIKAIEVRGIDHEMSNDKIAVFSDDNYQLTIHKFKMNHVQPLILGTSCKYHQDDTRNKMIEKSKQEILLAQKLGFKAIRVFGNLIQEDELTCIHKVSEALNQVCAFADDKNIQVFLEVHGDFNTIDVLKPLIDQISYNNFGLIWDVYHTHHVYGSNWKVFYEAMKPFIKHVHIKDAIKRQLVLPGEGEIAFKDIMDYMVKDGYDGYFSFEWERKWVPELCELDIALEKLTEILK